MKIECVEFGLFDWNRTWRKRVNGLNEGGKYRTRKIKKTYKYRTIDEWEIEECNSICSFVNLFSFHFPLPHFILLPSCASSLLLFAVDSIFCARFCSSHSFLLSFRLRLHSGNDKATVVKIYLNEMKCANSEKRTKIRSNVNMLSALLCSLFAL